MIIKLKNEERNYTCHLAKAIISIKDFNLSKVDSPASVRSPMALDTKHFIYYINTRNNIKEIRVQF